MTLTPERVVALTAFLEILGIPPAELHATQLHLVDEALTHTSTGRHINHERLEFLGDAVLRLAASEYIEHHHPQLPVGERSALRAQLVSDRWLAAVGDTIGIEAVQTVGAKARGDAAGRSTLRAEATEALIGALYQGWGSLQPVQTWLTPHWQHTSAAVLADPHKGNAKSALQEWSQARKLGLPTYCSDEHSQRHGDPKRFRCHVKLQGNTLAEGWGGSRRDAEQKAAQAALQSLEGDDS
ncbi:MAG: ribonuclease III [Synechococcus sp.]